MGDIAVISDLHLGGGGWSDPFRMAEQELERFLKFLEVEFETTVLLGDIFEALKGSQPGREARNLSACFRAHPEIAARLLGRNSYVYVAGNHDRVAGELWGVPERLLMELWGIRVLFLHGHQFDGAGGGKNRLAGLLVWLGGCLQNLGWHRLYRLFEKAERKLSGAVPDPGLCPFQRWAQAEGARNGADWVVAGHTHQGRVDMGAVAYANSGTCSSGQFEYLTLTSRSEISFRVWGGYSPPGAGTRSGRTWRENVLAIREGILHA